jgi:hypothetical protein
MIIVAKDLALMMSARDAQSKKTRKRKRTGKTGKNMSTSRTVYNVILHKNKIRNRVRVCTRKRKQER